MPETDVFIFTPPCQMFSDAGSKRGASDSRGQLVRHSLKYLKYKRPRLAIMENVAALKTHAKISGTLRKLVKALCSMQYKTHKKIMDTCTHGVPQRRKRLYIVAIRQDSCVRRFNFPRGFPLPQGAAKSLLGADDCASPTTLPAAKFARRNVKLQFKRVLWRGVDPRKTFVAVDMHASPKYRTAKAHCLPTLTASRASSCGWWISSVGRPITVSELLRFQGMTANDVRGWTDAVSKNQMGHMVGNALSVNVIERILCKALWAAGLVANKPCDRWACGDN